MHFPLCDFLKNLPPENYIWLCSGHNPVGIEIKPAFSEVLYFQSQAVGNCGDMDNFQSEISGLVLENASVKHQMDSTHSVK